MNVLIVIHANKCNIRYPLHHGFRKSR